jgi:hypothetical protein
MDSVLSRATFLVRRKMLARSRSATFVWAKPKRSKVVDAMVAKLFQNRCESVYVVKILKGGADVGFKKVVESLGSHRGSEVDLTFEFAQ